MPMTQQRDKIVDSTEMVRPVIEASDDDDHRATMDAAYDRAIANASEETETEDFEHEETEDEVEETPKSRARDESGKFTKSKTAPESEVAQTTESNAAPAIESVPAAIPVPAPPGWAADAAPLFNQLPPRLQQEVVRRETDLRRGMQQATERAATVERTWAAVQQQLAPYEQTFARNGVTPDRVIGQLMSWQKHLDANPVQALQDLAGTYGLDLRQVAQQVAEQPQEPAYVRELRQQVQQIGGLFSQQQQQAQNQQQQVVVSQIEAFANEKDATGQPLRPYIEHVIDDMLPILQTLRASGMPTHQMLQQAYEKAIWMNPSTREIELRKSSPVVSQAVEKAKRAQKLVNGVARVATPDDVPDSRSAMAAVYDRHSK